MSTKACPESSHLYTVGTARAWGVALGRRLASQVVVLWWLTGFFCLSLLSLFSLGDYAISMVSISMMCISKMSISMTDRYCCCATLLFTSREILGLDMFARKASERI